MLSEYPEATKMENILSSSSRPSLPIDDPFKIFRISPKKSSHVSFFDKNASKKSVKNSELWIELDQMTSYHEVSWYWVKGHSNHRENDIADALANKGIDELK